MVMLKHFFFWGGLFVSYVFATHKRLNGEKAFRHLSIYDVCFYFDVYRL